MDERALRIELDAMKGEMTLLFAENMALQLVVTQMLHQMRLRPEMRPVVDQAFDQAANLAEQFSISRGRKSGHMPETLRIIEQLRIGATGGNKPKHGV
jgi:hypothetical protein